MADVTVSQDKEALAIQENEELLALLEGKKELEPGDVLGEEIDHGKDSEISSKVTTVSSAGYVLVFDRRTGDSSIVNRNMLPTQLRKRDPDSGMIVFTLIDPGIRPTAGVYKCLLHKDSPEREEFTGLGLAVCKKANLKTPYQQTRHMTKRHTDEWRLMQDIKAREKDATDKSERKEDRDFQRMILDRLTRGDTDARTYRSGEEKEEGQEEQEGSKEQEGQEVDGE